MGNTRFLVRALLLVALSATAAGCAWRKQAQIRREVAYQAALCPYSDALKPGMTRKEVEDYLHSNNAQFQRMCCVDERSALADLINSGMSILLGIVASTGFTLRSSLRPRT